MEQTSYTPGPWRVTAVGQCGRKHSPGLTEPLFSVDVRAKDNSNPCVFVFTESEEKQNLADARLIAAAPDLFVLCQQALFYISEVGGNDSLELRLESVINRVNNQSKVEIKEED